MKYLLLKNQLNKNIFPSICRYIETNQCPKTAPEPKKTKIHQLLTETENKVRVVSIDIPTAISLISVTFLAGAAFEIYDNLGITHYIRSMAGLSTESSSAFRITRMIQKIGGNIYCSTDRDLMKFTMVCPRNHVYQGLGQLVAVATQPLFRPWEIRRNLVRIEDDVLRANKSIKVIELLHKAAFPVGLGNSLFCKKTRIGIYESEDLHSYFDTFCTSSRCVLAGIGIDHDTLEDIAQRLPLEVGDPSIKACTPELVRNELRKEMQGDLSYVAIAAAGSSITSPEDSLAHSILQHAFGSETLINVTSSFQSDNSGLLRKILNNAITDQPFIASTFNYSYQEHGLFGVFLCANQKTIEKVMNLAMQLLTQGTIQDIEIDKGKNVLKTCILYKTERSDELIGHSSKQAMYLRRLYHIKEILKIIDDVPNEKVKSIAKKIASGQFAMAAVGHLGNVPSLDNIL